MRRVCGECLSDIGEKSLCPNCGSLGFVTVTRGGEVASFSPEMGVPCNECGRTGLAIRFAQLRRVVGLIFVDQVYTRAGYFCSSCRRRLFFKFQALTLVFGWWGLFAMLIRNPYAILSNFMALGRQPILPGARNVVSLQQLQAAHETEAAELLPPSDYGDAYGGTPQ